MLIIAGHLVNQFNWLQQNYWKTLISSFDSWSSTNFNSSQNQWKYDAKNKSIDIYKHSFSVFPVCASFLICACPWITSQQQIVLLTPFPSPIDSRWYQSCTIIYTGLVNERKKKKPPVYWSQKIQYSALEKKDIRSFTQQLCRSFITVRKEI